MALNSTSIANYISGDTTMDSFYFAGMGFTKMDESPNAESKESAYISDQSKSKEVVSYSPSFSFSAEMMLEEGATEEAIQSLYNIAYYQQAGNDGMRWHVRVDMYKGPTMEASNTFPARLFRISPEISSTAAPPADKMTMEGTLNTYGSTKYGTFDTVTRKFVEVAGMDKPTPIPPYTPPTPPVPEET